MQQYLREIACVAFMLWDRERLRGWSKSGDHAGFEQQAVQSFGDAPAGEDREAYIQELKKAVQTQKNFFERLNKADTVTVQGLPFCGKSLVRRAKQRALFLADEGFATAHPDYFPDGDYSSMFPGRNGELFDAFAAWTMREHPGWTTLRDIDNHCRSQKQWKPPAWVAVFFDRIFPQIVAILFTAAIRVLLFPLE